jgi:hypothetical protein
LKYREGEGKIKMIKLGAKGKILTVDEKNKKKTQKVSQS